MSDPVSNERVTPLIEHMRFITADLYPGFYLFYNFDGQIKWLTKKIAYLPEEEQE
jgi:hypothetical protein